MRSLIFHTSASTDQASRRPQHHSRRLSDPGRPSRPPSLVGICAFVYSYFTAISVLIPVISIVPMQRFETLAAGDSPTYPMPRTQTVEFATPNVPRRRRLDKMPTEMESIRTGTDHEHGSTCCSPSAAFSILILASRTNAPTWISRSTR